MAYSKDEYQSHSWRYHAVGNTGIPVDSSGRQETIVTKTGLSVPKYRSIIKSHGNATSAYSRTAMLKVVKLEPFGGNVVTNPFRPPNLIVRESVAGTWFPHLPPGGSQDGSDASTLALQRLYKRLSEQQTHFHAMQFLGELHETIALFKHPFRTAKSLVDKYFDTVRENASRYRPRRSLPGRRKFEKAIADSWLETAFGIRPLISDVKDAAKAAMTLAYDNNLKRDRIVGTGQTFVSGSELSTTTGVAGTNFVKLKSHAVGRIEHLARYEAFLDWSRSAATGSLGRVLEVTGFRPDLFIPTLYELAPWSFLVDYFTNLGTVIETGCQSQANVKGCLLSLSITNTQTTQIEILGLSDGSSDSSIISGSPGSFDIARKSFVRSNTLAQIPQVPFQFSLPGKPTQYLNMLALWRSKVKDV